MNEYRTDPVCIMDLMRVRDGAIAVYFVSDPLWDSMKELLAYVSPSGLLPCTSELRFAGTPVLKFPFPTDRKFVIGIRKGADFSQLTGATP